MAIYNDGRKETKIEKTKKTQENARPNGVQRNLRQNYVTVIQQNAAIPHHGIAWLQPCIKSTLLRI